MVEQSGSQPVELTREEMHAAFPGEWVLARITKWRGRMPLTGYIIAHDRSDGEVSTHIPRGATEGEYYFFNCRKGGIEAGPVDIYPVPGALTVTLPRALARQIYPELHLP